MAYRGRETGVLHKSVEFWRLHAGLNPKAPAWTPGPSSSGDRRGDSLGRIGRAVHGVGTHKSVDGAETLGVGGLNLPAKEDNRRANLYSQRVQQAIQKKTNK